MSGFSSAFLREVVREIERCEKRIDKLDQRIEHAARKSAKHRLSGERAAWVRYQQWLRASLLK